MAKVMGSVSPRTDQPLEVSEHHYSAIHHTFCRRMMYADAPTIVRYYSDLAMHQYSVAGRFDQKSEEWRITTLEYSDDNWMVEKWAPEWAAAVLWRDHANCLGDFGSTCVVEPKIVADRLSKQTCLQKYLIKYTLPPHLTPEAAHSYYDEQIFPKLKTLLEGATGFRLWETNRIVGAMGVITNDEGLEVLDTALHPTPLLRYDEIYFDNAGWGGEFFAQPGAFDVIQKSQLGTSAFLIRHDGQIDRS